MWRCQGFITWDNRVLEEVPGESDPVPGFTRRMVLDHSINHRQAAWCSNCGPTGLKSQPSPSDSFQWKFMRRAHTSVFNESQSRQISTSQQTKGQNISLSKQWSGKIHESTGGCPGAWRRWSVTKESSGLLTAHVVEQTERISWIKSHRAWTHRLLWVV